ncbi:MAG TPA: hypothetical protein ENK71_01565, partial [Epsilonproteobacteria bacterium]|nr:hypothetical protein [Campylobacterota bacterium]
MDKEKREIFALPKRRGFTLLLTLSVMTVIIALMAVVVRYYAEAKAEADRTAALLQANLFYATVAEGLASIPQQKELLDFLYTTSVPLMTDDGRGSILLTCVPASYGVNINWLSYPHDANKSYL